MVESEKGHSELSEYVAVSEWLDREEAWPFFPNPSSLQWFIKMNRDKLVASGALIPRAGRAGSLLHRVKFPKQVIAVHRLRAKRKIGMASTVPASTTVDGSK
jgi:hypothetical protein